MDADNLKPIAHNGFAVDANSMAAVLVDGATHEDDRAAIKRSSTASSCCSLHTRPR